MSRADPTNTDELEAALATMITIVDGPAVAYFEDQKGRRVYYQTVALGVAAKLTPKSQTALCKAVLDELEPVIRAYADAHPGEPLYWRRRPVISQEGRVTKIRMRIGGPDFTLPGSKVEGLGTRFIAAAA